MPNLCISFVYTNTKKKGLNIVYTMYILRKRGKMRNKYFIVSIVLVFACLFLLISLYSILQEAKKEKQGEEGELPTLRLSMGISTLAEGECGNGVCETEIGENSKNCAIDCGSLLTQDFSDMMKFYEVRYYSTNESPVEGVEFTLEYKYEDIDSFQYISITNIHTHINFSKEEAVANVVALNNSDLDYIFSVYNNSDQKVRKDIIQRFDIEKLCRKNFSEQTCNFGIQNDSNLKYLLGADGNAIPDRPIEDYQNGKTIVYPFGYNKGIRFYFNFNNLAVREYAIKYVLFRQGRVTSAKNRVFLDNFVPSDDYVTERWRNYISKGTIQEQRENISLSRIELIKEIKNRNKESKIILNGFQRSTDETRKLFIDLVNREENKDSFDMIMFENYYWYDDWATAPTCINIKTYSDILNKLKENNKNVLFVASHSESFTSFNSLKAYKIWLWTHLVGNNLSYFYSNPNYTSPMINYTTYHYKLGMPLGELYNISDTWYREFERGTIVFNTSFGKLDVIEFIEKDKPEPPGNNGNGGNGGGRGGGGGGKCVPENKTKTCLNIECGEKINNCNKSVNCGNCSAGFNCINGKCTNLISCITESKETTCEDWICGEKKNNCNETINCGSCRENESCENGICKARETPKPSKIIELIKKYYLYGIIVLLVIGISIVLFLAISKLKRKKKISSLGEKVRIEGRIREAKNLILNARGKGYSNDFIKKLFLNKGWNEKLVNKLVGEVK